MALLLAILRTLVDDNMPLPALARRLNIQVGRHAPASRFITLFLASFDPATGALTFVNAGQTPPLPAGADGEHRAPEHGQAWRWGWPEGADTSRATSSSIPATRW
ncbi:MAG: SpoIIE family protein phosphatase [Vicinamibacterales bacterium]